MRSSWVCGIQGRSLQYALWDIGHRRGVEHFILQNHKHECIAQTGRAIEKLDTYPARIRIQESPKHPVLKHLPHLPTPIKENG